MSPLRVGIQLPHYGPPAETIGIAPMVEAIVAAGFDGIWVSDHVVLVEDAPSQYPYAATGEYGFPAGTPWYEALITLAHVAALTDAVELGTSICVLAQREPVLFAKQAASIDWLSGGRLCLGIGVGWLAEEFEALGADFGGRAERTGEWARLIRACWTGTPQPGHYGDRELPAGVRCEPSPAGGSIPLLIGGNSRAAFRRLAAYGDGWLGAAPRSGLGPGELRAMISGIREACDAAGRDPGTLELALRIAPRMSQLGSAEFADQIAAYAGVGITRLTVDLAWQTLQAGVERLALLADSVAAARAVAR